MEGNGLDRLNQPLVLCIRLLHSFLIELHTNPATVHYSDENEQLSFKIVAMVKCKTPEHHGTIHTFRHNYVIFIKVMSRGIISNDDF